MKVLALALLCVVAVQGRSAVVQKESRALAALGEHPYLLHLRVAINTSGFLETCAGSLIGNAWALTTASCVASARFMWVRYGAVSVINPSLVTEATSYRVHPAYAGGAANNVGLVSINRNIEVTSNIAPIALIGASVPDSATFCAFGDNGADGPGEQLSCFEVSLTQADDVITATSDESATKFDVGAPLVSEGVQVGLLIAGADGDSSGTFISTADYVSWIEEESGLSLSRAIIPELAM